MPKINGGFITAIFIALSPTASSAVRDSVNSAWGNPTYPSSLPDTSSNTDFWLQDKINLTDSEDAAIIIYMAQRIVEHGGYFCATQIRTDHRRLFLFSGLVRFQYPSGDPQKTCINKKWSKCKFGGIPTVQTAKPVLKTNTQVG